jgi:hypothetical protein
VAIRLLVKRSVVAAFLIIAFVLQGTTSVLAGTTGTIQGTVTDASTGTPVAGAHVTALSPSQNATAVTDASGRYTFLSLNPDTYTISSAPVGNHDATSVSGVTVQADQTQTVSLRPSRHLTQIGAVTSRAASALVKPGTTADVYSMNAVQQDKASSFGGGGTLNSAWSAITSVPGVYVAPGQNGYIGAGASLSIRGGDYDQIGYEFDGVPVNRSFDNYPSGTLSSLGQQEVQVYTGANPANAEANGLSGYINQVIRTGTAPAYRDLTLAAGGPTFYNKFAFETGGANPSRTFSYYVGLGGYNQDYRYFDQYNGAGLSPLYGTPLDQCAFVAHQSAFPSCNNPITGEDYSHGGTTNAWALGPTNLGLIHENDTRDTVVNLHFGLPKADGTRDDIQMLLDIDHLSEHAYTSVNDMGGPTYVANAFAGNVGGSPFYIDGYQYAGKPGSVLNPATAPGMVSPYYFPQSPSGRPFQSALPNTTEGGQANDQNIFKLQYQHNFGTNAFLRVYGYTYYSDWMMTDPTAAVTEYLAGTFGAFSPDYELSSHTRGLSAQFSDQISPSNLLTVQGNYTTATSTRDNNTEWYNGLYGPNSVNARTAIGVVVNSAAPTSGYCFSNTGAAVGCGYSHANTATGAQYVTLQQAMAGANLVLPATCALPGVATTTCEYLTVGNGQYATYNTVAPKFTAGSITDNWKPTDKLSFDIGLRLDQFQFDTSSQNDNAARQLYYNSFNIDNCFTNATNAIVAITPGSACPAGTHVPNVIDQNGGTTTYSALQPRIGATYSIDPTTVVRASYGRYTQAPNSAFEQYDSLQANQPYLLYNTYNFQQFGFNSSLHNVGPEISNNFDFSLEKSFGRDLSVKLTPFLRKTQGQIQQFFLSYATSFVSGLNVGRQTSQGLEFEVDKGDFARNGLAAKLSFTYTNSYINYTPLATGGTVLDGLNANIKNYNAYTSFCASNPTDARCAGGATQSGASAQCYAAGAPGSGLTVAPVGGACPTGSIANPYWNAPVQSLLNASNNLATYDILPGPPGTNGNAYGAPFVSTLLVQYKKDRFSVTPALEFVGGQKYGTPQTTSGVAPDLCAGGFQGTTRYDISTCTPGGGDFYGYLPGYNMVVPNQLTGTFDNLGAFTEPNILSLHLQVAYDVSKNVTLVGTFANLYSACFGGTNVPWKVSGACGYSPNNYIPIGNNYNPGQSIQPYVAAPYLPFFNATPFNMYVEARIKV